MTDIHQVADELEDAVRYEQLCRLTRPTTAAEADELERLTR